MPKKIIWQGNSGLTEVAPLHNLLELHHYSKSDRALIGERKIAFTS